MVGSPAWMVFYNNRSTKHNAVSHCDFTAFGYILFVVNYCSTYQGLENG